jgi:hypothetical protein
MTDRIIEVHSDGGSTSGALTVVAVVLGLIVMLAVLYFSGIFGRRPAKHEVDINITKPGVVLQLR